MIKISQLCLISLLLIINIANAANIHLKIEGLSEILEKNVRTQLSAIQNNNIKHNTYLQVRIENTIKKSLRALGYYEPEIDFHPHSDIKKGDQSFDIHINPGKPIRINQVKIILRGDARTDYDYLNLLKKSPMIGTILNHKDYDNFKKSLTNIALHKGYFDSQFNKNELGVILTKHQAFWNIDYDSGQRYRFGIVTFEGSSIHNKYFQNLVPFKKGDFYESKMLAELNRRLSSTGWFNSIIITPKFNESPKYKVLSLHVIVSPCIRNTVETGIGYSTHNGPHVNISWKKPRINSYGHKMMIRSGLSIKEQQINFVYKIPLLKNSLKHYYLLQSIFKHININNIKKNSTDLVISRYWNIFNGWKQAISLHYNFDHFSHGDNIYTTTLLYSDITISRSHSDIGLIPTWGNSQRYAMYCSNTFWSSDVNFIVMQAQNVWIRTLYDKYRFIIRSNLSWIKANNLNKVPSFLYFLSGGEHNIRIYNENSFISFKKKKDIKLISTLKIVNDSLEYQYNLAKKWWSSFFIDISEAVHNIFYSNFKTRTGIGIRWESPIGLIKIDCALPVKDQGKHHLRFYIGFGPEL